MGHTLLSQLQLISQKSFPILLSFVDDALLLILTRLGLYWPWLEWLSLAVMVATILYWGYRLVYFLYQKYRVN